MKGGRALSLVLFENERTVKPFAAGTKAWDDVVQLHAVRLKRAAKSGPMLGAYELSGTRCDRNVARRSLIQLDIDTTGVKDKHTGELIAVEKQAPLLADLRSEIDEFEWMATSTHWHDPARGVIKYRITMLPDRDIEPTEHHAVLEALDEVLQGALDRGAWPLCQAFYLPSCPPQNVDSCFFIRNQGAALPVDPFVQRGHELMKQRVLAKSLAPATVDHRAPAAILETPANIERVMHMLATIPAGIERRAWRNAVWALAATGWSRAEQLARDWSMTDPRQWDAAAFDSIWSSFDPARPDAIRVSTLEHTARAHGYAGPPLIAVEDFDGKGADVKNGQFFAAMWRHKLVYIHETATWLHFDPGSGWLKTDPFQEDQAAKEVLALLQRTAAERLVAQGSEAVQKQMKHIQYTSRAPHLRAMIDMAKSEKGMTVRLADFDSDPMLLGVSNGVLDLRSGKLQSVTPGLLVSKRCSVTFEPGAACPRFLKFIEEVQPDADVRQFLQRWAGYCLTGTVGEQVFAFFYGSGANGKSVFIELLAWLMGDYAHKIATEMLMHHQRNPQGPSPDIVALKGVRLAYANETEEGRRLADARVKELTGGDTLTGRIPYAKADVAFRPSHKLVVAGNHKPEISDMSNGMWRRVLLVGFGTTIPEEQQDKALLAKLQLEGSGILNWALEGLRRWQADGLNVPIEIKRSTAEYREEQDIIGEWISDRCLTGASYRVPKADLYADYSGWAKTNGHIPLAQGRLTKRLTERGFQLQRDKRTVAGLTLKPAGRLGMNF